MGNYIDKKMIVSMVAASLLTAVVMYAITKIPASVPGSTTLKAATGA